MLRAYEESNLPRPRRRGLAWLSDRLMPKGRVETAAAAKPPRPPVGIASDADAAHRSLSAAASEANSGVETAAAAKPPRPPVGIASDADAGLG
jgi:hypothetical protein